MVGNSAGADGGVSGAVTFRNCLIVNNSPNDTASYTSQGSNIISSTSDMHLGPLTNNGGPTLTHALLPGSPAIDAGDDALTGTDQRGRPRRSGAHVDIGAFEFAVPRATAIRKATNGVILNLTGDPPFSVVSATNVATPSNQWINLGPATAIGAGAYEFTDTTATNTPDRFFRLRWP